MTPLWAIERPDWVAHPPSEDAHFQYYIGRSGSATNESVGVSEATLDASEQAIKQNFGFKTQVSTQSYESTDKSDSTKRIQEISRNVELHDFEQVGFYSEAAQGNRINIWLLYRYSKAAIAQEKIRLASVKEEVSKVVFSQQGADTDAVNGVLEVISKPDASVMIDGEGWGRTPLRIVGKLPIGEHIVRLDHPAHESIEEKVIIIQGTTIKINRTLIPATAKLKVSTNLLNAAIVIDGKLSGTTPTEELTVPAARPIKIELSPLKAKNW